MRNHNFGIAYDYVRQRILSGEYPPGRALVTKRLSDETGVSRTPVRDALLQLALEGLVTVEARLGASVTRMDLTEFKEMGQMRLALESHAAALAALHRTADELHHIRTSLVAMRQIVRELAERDREPDALLTNLGHEDVRFHLAIITAAKNGLMKKKILRLQLIHRVVAGPTSDEETRSALTKAETDQRRRMVLADHDEIYAAIEACDGHKARQAMAGHLQRVLERKLLSMSRAPFGADSPRLPEDELVYLD